MMFFNHPGLRFGIRKIEESSDEKSLLFLFALVPDRYRDGERFLIRQRRQIACANPEFRRARNNTR
jgi:hypothetical protein